MGRRKTNILHEGEGIIRNIKWLNDLIAWSNEKVNLIFFYKIRIFPNSIKLLF